MVARKFNLSGVWKTHANTSDSVVRGHHCPYFFKDQNGATVTVNVNTYCIMITVFMPAVDGIVVDNVWFKQNGSTCHISYATIDLFN